MITERQKKAYGVTVLALLLYVACAMTVASIGIWRTVPGPGTLDVILDQAIPGL